MIKSGFKPRPIDEFTKRLSELDAKFNDQLMKLENVSMHLKLTTDAFEKKLSNIFKNNGNGRAR